MSLYVFAGDKQIEKGEILTKLNGTAACGSPTTGTDKYGNVTDDIGVMDYSSARSSGTIKFFVTMNDLANQPTAQGSGEAGVNPAAGEHHPVNVSVVARL